MTAEQIRSVFARDSLLEKTFTGARQVINGETFETKKHEDGSMTVYLQTLFGKEPRMILEKKGFIPREFRKLHWATFIVLPKPRVVRVSLGLGRIFNSI